MQPITVQEMFDYALQYEHVVLAHYIYWGIEQQLVSLTDDAEKLKNMSVDKQAVRQYAERNVLGMQIIKLYVIQHTDESYAFYFALDSLTAHSEHMKLFGTQSKSIVEAPSLMHKLMYIDTVGDELFLIDYKQQFVQFPVYIGHAKPRCYELYQLDRQVKQRAIY